MSWIEHVENPVAIHSMFSVTPALEKVELHELVFHRDGPRISMRIELNDYPDEPPQRWLVQKFNRAQLILMATDIRSAELRGWQTRNTCTISVSRGDDLLSLTLVGGATQILIETKFLFVDKLSGYQVTESF